MSYRIAFWLGDRILGFSTTPIILSGSMAAFIIFDSTFGAVVSPNSSGRNSHRTLLRLLRSHTFNFEAFFYYEIVYMRRV
ncbi:hypothetical protein AYI69_g8612 [Smittium culicis]|uniref:Uncharacterized protein n=1 Tax=Smittium culicis TaxID=133412 RepID=A0A1R1XIF2_9FUNG|nr:hypothetical protein AYI69_g8612 [Smittium culicis]